MGKHWFAQCSLSGITESLNHDIDYVILLSGADYLIKNNAYINNFLLKMMANIFFHPIKYLPIWVA